LKKYRFWDRFGNGSAGRYRGGAIIIMGLKEIRRWLRAAQAIPNLQK
jgi:hypothetical protein